MTNNFAQYLFSEEMMSNEIAQQIRTCLATLQHAQNRLQTNSDALISMMRQKAKIAESLKLEEKSKRLVEQVRAPLELDSVPQLDSFGAKCFGAIFGIIAICLFFHGIRCPLDAKIRTGRKIRLLLLI